MIATNYNVCNAKAWKKHWMVLCMEQHKTSFLGVPSKICVFMFVMAVVCVISRHDDVMTWKHYLHYWPFVRGIHWSPVDSPHKGSVMQSFHVSFDASLNKLLKKQLRDRWNEMSWCSFDVTIISIYQTVIQCGPTSQLCILMHKLINIRMGHTTLFNITRAVILVPYHLCHITSKYLMIRHM